MSKDDLGSLIEFLHAETLQLDNQMRSNLNQVYQFGVLAFTILGIAATVLGQNKEYVALLALAPVAPTVWLMGLRTLVEMFALAASRHWLERRLQGLVNQSRAGVVFVPWDDAAGQVTRTTIANSSVFACFLVAAIAVCGGSLAAAWQALPHLRAWTILDIIVCGGLVAASFAAANQLRFVQDNTERLLAAQAERGARTDYDPQAEIR